MSFAVSTTARPSRNARRSTPPPPPETDKLDALCRALNDPSMSREQIDALVEPAIVQRAAEAKWLSTYGRCQVVAFEGPEAGHAMEDLVRFEQEVLASRRAAHARRRAIFDHHRHRPRAPRRRAPRSAAGTRRASASTPSRGPGPPAPADAPGDSDEDDAHARRVGGAVRLRHVDLPALRVRRSHPIRADVLPARPQRGSRRGTASARATPTAREEASAA